MIPIIGEIRDQQDDKDEEQAAAAVCSTTVEINKVNFGHVIEFKEVPPFYQTDPNAFAKLLQMFTGG